MGLNKKDRKQYVSVLADGKLHMTVPEGTEGSEIRHYELSDGTKGEKNEIQFDSLDGIISKIEFFEGSYGNSLQLEISDGEGEPVVLSLAVKQNFAEDVMKKLPNIDMKKEVNLVPFAFKDDNGKEKKGITIYQNEEKVENYFYDKEAKKPLFDFPEVSKEYKDMKSSDWEMYFMEAQKFLVDYTTEHFVTEVDDDF